MRSDAGGDYLIYIAWPQDRRRLEGIPSFICSTERRAFAIAAEYENRLGSYSGMAPGIVVGIGYPDASRRTFDYTPAVPDGVDTAPAKGPTGGGDAFLDFWPTRSFLPWKQATPSTPIGAHWRVIALAAFSAEGAKTPPTCSHLRIADQIWTAMRRSEAAAGI